MGFFILIGLCLTVLGGGCLAVKPLNQNMKLNPFEHLMIFYLMQIKRTMSRTKSFLFPVTAV